MATSEVTTSISFPANADLSAKAFYWGTLSSGKVVVAGDGALGVGLIGSDPPSVADRACELVISGVGKMIAGAAISELAEIASDAAGKGITATTGEQINAIALEAAAADGDIIKVLVVRAGATAA